ncbi:hypothetical protein [Porphyrobacter sp. ULC335]|uniref:hypothetical protein n=1 Tax=Porphyrobacter sp. ULC335 TaxID=2854260 RepID=UPI00221FF7F8|nr:hypothetical protein [Porphyrobacter sp. ULC335]UYV14774.1 hypothetical protein KVF90_11540 [Porphyrobacter sp. ULC335]
MHPLMLHVACDLGPIRAVTASVTATPNGCEAEFRLEGMVPATIVPPPAKAERMDNLWQTTCFEIFWQPLGGTAYREFNLSPSGRWAAYDFDSFREGMRDAPVSAIAIACSHDDAGLVLKASIAADLPTPAQVALNAIVEHANGAKQYWALAFPPGKPEFHSEANRQLILER